MAMPKTDNIPNADSETLAAIAAIVKHEIQAALASEEERTIATVKAVVTSELKGKAIATESEENLASELDERTIATVKAVVTSELDERAIATESEEKVTTAETRKRVVILMLFGGIAGYVLAKAYLS